MFRAASVALLFSLLIPAPTCRGLPSVEAAEDFYLEALEELDRRIVIKYVAEQNCKAAGIKVEEIVDTSGLKKLDSEGFFEKVYGGKCSAPGWTLAALV